MFTACWQVIFLCLYVLRPICFSLFSSLRGYLGPEFGVLFLSFALHLYSGVKAMLLLLFCFLLFPVNLTCQIYGTSIFWFRATSK